MSTKLSVCAGALLFKLRHLIVRLQTQPVLPAAAAAGPAIPPAGTPDQGQLERSEMANHVFQVVRRAIHKRPNSAPEVRTVHAIARRLAGPDWDQRPGDREDLVRLVARDLIARLCNPRYQP